MDAAQFKQDIKLAHLELVKPQRSLQRAMLQRLAEETERKRWYGGIVPPKRLGSHKGTASTARALIKLGLIIQKPRLYANGVDTISRHGLKLTELGAEVARRLPKIQICDDHGGDLESCLNQHCHECGDVLNEETARLLGQQDNCDICIDKIDEES